MEQSTGGLFGGWGGAGDNAGGSQGVEEVRVCSDCYHVGQQTHPGRNPGQGGAQIGTWNGQVSSLMGGQNLPQQYLQQQHLQQQHLQQQQLQQQQLQQLQQQQLQQQRRLSTWATEPAAVSGGFTPEVNNGEEMNGRRRRQSVS